MQEGTTKGTYRKPALGQDGGIKPLLPFVFSTRYFFHYLNSSRTGSHQSKLSLRAGDRSICRTMKLLEVLLLIRQQANPRLQTLKIFKGTEKNPTLLQFLQEMAPAAGPCSGNTGICTLCTPGELFPRSPTSLYSQSWHSLPAILNNVLPPEESMLPSCQSPPLTYCQEETLYKDSFLPRMALCSISTDSSLGKEQGSELVFPFIFKAVCFLPTYPATL